MDDTNDSLTVVEPERTADDEGSLGSREIEGVDEVAVELGLLETRAVDETPCVLNSAVEGPSLGIFAVAKPLTCWRSHCQ